MSRAIKRVPLGFDQPMNKVWSGYLMSDTLHGKACTDCGGSGYAPRARELSDLWYGNAPFKPEDRGSTPFTIFTPEVRAFAERNVTGAPHFYGTGEIAILREAQRLVDLWNGAWCHHLNADDVAALIEGNRLTDFTHTWNQKTRRWVPIDPTPVVTPEQVNRWSLQGLAHDSINQWIVVSARCKQEGVPEICATCGGHGNVEAYPGQRAEAEAWKPTEPPTGEGWQAWETVSDGSPISPVFPTREGLVGWFMSPAYNMGVSTPLTREQAEGLIDEGGTSISFVMSEATGEGQPGDQLFG